MWDFAFMIVKLYINISINSAKSAYVPNESHSKNPKEHIISGTSEKRDHDHTHIHIDIHINLYS